MIDEHDKTEILTPKENKSSVLITISTPGADTPICRLGNSEAIIKDLTVRQLIQRAINPSSLFSVGVPMSQLQAESPTSLAIAELLAVDCCEVVSTNRGGEIIGLDQPASEAAKEQTGNQGNKFLNVVLEVRPISDSMPCGEERRYSFDASKAGSSVTVFASADSKTSAVASTTSPREFALASLPDASMEPKVIEEEPTTKEERADSITNAEENSVEFITQEEPTPTEEKKEDLTVEAAPSLDSQTNETESAADEQSAVEEPKEEATSEIILEPDAPPTEEQAASEKQPSKHNVFTIVAEPVSDMPKVKEQPKERKEYIRKSDWLRAQFLPEVENLDFSGLFVGNLGLGIREEKIRRNVILADPSRITEVLLRANGYRRNEDHAKALICYQELVDMDPSNADFRFLLGKTYLAIGHEDEAVESLQRAKELGHDGADKELAGLKRSGHRPRAALGFLRFWKQ